MSKPRLRASSSAATTFFEPPLVDIAKATSAGRDCAISWRTKVSSTPTSLAIAERIAGSAASEIAGIGACGVSSTQSSAKSVASVAEPPLPKISSRPPAASRCAIADDRGGDGLALLGGDLFAQALAVARLLDDRVRDAVDDRGRVGLLGAQVRVQKRRRADIVAQLAPMFEEHVHALVERVAEHLERFLVQVRSSHGAATA